MILIADSGSTKCDWIITGKQTSISVETEGLNPFFMEGEQMTKVLIESKLNSFKDDIVKVFFYGAACSTEPNVSSVAKVLGDMFKNASINVNHDLLGAARASCGNNEAFCGILGTGSNLCYYDGVNVHRKTRSLGFILGDEGSGSNIGKRIVRAYLYKELPDDLNSKFQEFHKEQDTSITNKLYTSRKPNQFLASFAKFAVENKEHPFIHQIVQESFSSFFSIHLWKYEHFRSLPVNFIGSIAFYFQDILQEVAINHRFTAGKIVQRPIKELALYHQKNL